MFGLIQGFSLSKEWSWKNKLNVRVTHTGGDDGSASISTRDGSSSPISLASAGTGSLQQDEDSLEGSASKEGDKSKVLEQSCQELVTLIEELQWHHAQVHVT